MTPGVALRLGRVSNLPTVWSNVLAALALAGAPLYQASTLALLVAMSLFYVGGMYLNDAFDAPRDARERAERPIPMGQVSRGTVFAVGFGGLALGVGILAAIGMEAPESAAAGLALAAAIVVYDVWHKDNPISPVLMGLNRLLVYVAAAVVAVGAVSTQVVGAGALLLCYVIGLTYAAKQEHLARIDGLWPLAFLVAPFVVAAAYLPSAPAAAGLVALAFVAWTVRAVGFLVRPAPQVGRAVVSLIAGISLFDATVLAILGDLAAAALAVAAFGLTLVLQRYVPGT
ncbi:hypothetical protein DRB17_05785 [Ferruginivarius sediminum]|uniref:Prenyltransferase n=2 Tax=Ferruginivarius sediminum TaxID=2661937 RepID=A0A369TCY0_9PROT|nr:hypothetical protein DRB17_05785 [Ferruginivarius sediminum]